MKNVSLCTDQCSAGRLVIVRVAKTFKLQFSHTVNVINVKLCMIISLPGVYQFIPDLMTFALF